MKYTISDIKKSIDDIYDEIIDIRRDIHMHPDLSGSEKRTAKVIGCHLDNFNIPHQDNVAGHGVIGIIKGQNPNKALAIRADIDALPIVEGTDVPYKSTNNGVMHACGHDIHTAILLGTGKILKAMESDLPMGVKLFFQPAEETTGGAKQMIDAGCMENPKVSKVLGLHVETSVPVGNIQLIPGSMNAASTEFHVKVIGKSSHGAHPDKGIDPLIPACSMVSSLQTVVSRRMDPLDAGLITVGQFHSGIKNNIIPDETSFSGIIRALNLKQREFIKNQLQSICINIATAHGAMCEVTFRDSYPSLENDDDMLSTVKAVAEEALGKDHVQYNTKPSLGADDFSYFCHAAKGLYFNIGTQKPGDTNAASIHNSCFDPDEACIKVGMLVEILGILKLMEAEKDEQ